MTSESVRDLTAEAVAQYDRSKNATDPFFDDAWEVLARAGDAAIDAALPYLDAEASNHRAAGAELVGRAGEMNDEPVKQRAHDLLFARLLGEGNGDVREALATGLNLIWSSRGDDAAPLALASHPNANARLAAAHSLALSTTDAPEDAAQRAALEMLKDDADSDVREWAAFGLETLRL